MDFNNGGDTNNRHTHCEWIFINHPVHENKLLCGKGRTILKKKKKRSHKKSYNPDVTTQLCSEWSRSASISKMYPSCSHWRVTYWLTSCTRTQCGGRTHPGSQKGMCEEWRYERARQGEIMWRSSSSETQRAAGMQMNMPDVGVGSYRRTDHPRLSTMQTPECWVTYKFTELVRGWWKGPCRCHCAWVFVRHAAMQRFTRWTW